ncbi:hypothetical protein C2845_PM01G47640 [Panicum miliaceum]|uniref:Uncharacterized protein n=1 Tax=Panicum miliaceum TaxID=4540 RepID=A0A3L6THK7_PANMI|nr:hypothetical protein C2845_PM01G47640 [Panicum miliaceum]
MVNVTTECLGDASVLIAMTRNCSFLVLFLFPAVNPSVPTAKKVGSANQSACWAEFESGSTIKFNRLQESLRKRASLISSSSPQSMPAGE